MAEPETPESQDQEDLAADWAAMAGVEEEEGGDGEGGGDPNEALASDWAEAMTQDDLASASAEPETAASDGSGRVLSQDEIDSLLGFDGGDQQRPRSGIDALINSNDITYERLPMLEVVFDRLERIMTTSVRNFTSENV
ncbi:MAG TPA: flagellar motor switch protein FliM, partial [Rhodospirillales bacterium]|nr:flagellar motor switch protein FliM [Rhodospirillales bacterium]